MVRRLASVIPGWRSSQWAWYAAAEARYLRQKNAPTIPVTHVVGSATIPNTRSRQAMVQRVKSVVFRFDHIARSTICPTVYTASSGITYITSHTKKGRTVRTKRDRKNEMAHCGVFPANKSGSTARF